MIIVHVGLRSCGWIVTVRRLLATTMCLAVSLTVHAESIAKALERLNHVDIPVEERVTDATDDGGIAAFGDYKFECRNQESFNPKEEARARARFQEFLAYFSRHPAPSKEQKAKRLVLLKAAIKAGSWRADYVDLVWSIWDNRADREALQSLSTRLTDFAERGVPIALYGYVHWMGSLPSEDRYRLLKIAIDRGSPQAMVRMSDHLGMRSLALRPMAKEMAACAQHQKEPGAYEVLGEIAWREGRWVDAYRFWGDGANKGCEACIDRMEKFAMLEPGFRLNDGAMDSSARLKALREYYAGQFLYQLTKMTELLEIAPPDMAFHVSDEQIVALIERQMQPYGESVLRRDDDRAEQDRHFQVRRPMRDARSAWVARDLSSAEQSAILDAVVSDHQDWMRLPEARLNPDAFSCRTLSLPSPDPEAVRWFEQGRSLTFGPEQEQAYERAAELGYWRAAARLVGLSLDDEDWESARPIVAWLLNRKVPSGFNKLADLLESMEGYDGGLIDSDLRALLTTLRWRAAQLGDPVAQSKMSRHFREAGRQDLADALLDCARRQNPEIQ